MGRFEDPELLKMAEEYASTIGQPVEEAMKTALRLALETQPRQRDPKERARRLAAMRENR
ncbi:hypothetical protein C882_1265 [Caenispirillum salinarum AK4]|uniref:Uncharacterized protein n=1 Tax=Caenispirillum salinarum AK4 TaxID=1238182 RepID=K9GP22_9PROT|nr:hypothetical protein [Caenispirillum salinarum]EKV27670.1 hypothetical protein C882_1265 [Caenispirillum salinarum AK4]